MGAVSEWIVTSHTHDMYPMYLFTVCNTLSHKLPDLIQTQETGIIHILMTRKLKFRDTAGVGTYRSHIQKEIQSELQRKTPSGNGVRGWEKPHKQARVAKAGKPTPTCKAFCEPLEGDRAPPRCAEWVPTPRTNS